MNVLIHADGGPGVGLGHVMRCTALANQLGRRGNRAQIAVDPVLKLSDHMKVKGAEVLFCASTVSAIREAAMAMAAECVVIDSYRWTTDDYHALKDRWTVVGFDDEAVRELPVDAVINGSLAAFDLRYQTTKATQLWLGPTYQVVREEFSLIPPRELTGPVRRVIALVGGADPLGLVPVLANLLDAAASRAGFNAEIICGPFSSMPVIQNLSQVNIIQNPLDLHERMHGADLAISAGGQTLFELARCGTPTIAFSSGNDQIPNNNALAKADVVWNAGDATHKNWTKEIDTAIAALVEDLPRRTSMSKAGQKLIDGFGVERLVCALESLRK